MQHGSVNHPSLCTLRGIREYFELGQLPEIGKECRPGKNGWELIDEAVRNNGAVEVTEDVRDDKERAMLQAVYSMAVATILEGSEQGKGT